MAVYVTLNTLIGDIEMESLKEYLVFLSSINIDEVIRIIRAAKTPNDAIAGLIERFNLSEIQARAIVEMRLRQLTGAKIRVHTLGSTDFVKTVEDELQAELYLTAFKGSAFSL